jgi:hypothetical protein
MTSNDCSLFIPSTDVVIFDQNTCLSSSILFYRLVKKGKPRLSQNPINSHLLEAQQAAGAVYALLTWTSLSGYCTALFVGYQCGGDCVPSVLLHMWVSPYEVHFIYFTMCGLITSLSPLSGNSPPHLTWHLRVPTLAPDILGRILALKLLYVSIWKKLLQISVSSFYSL